MSPRVESGASGTLDLGGKGRFPHIEAKMLVKTKQDRIDRGKSPPCILEIVETLFLFQYKVLEHNSK